MEVPVTKAFGSGCRDSTHRHSPCSSMQASIQKQMMIMMPIMFTFFLYQLPAGLVLYWIVSNTLSIGQSIITKRIIAQSMAAHEASNKVVIETAR